MVKLLIIFGPGIMKIMDIFHMIFALHDHLVLVEAAVSRKEVADGDGQEQVFDPGKTKQLEADEHGGDRTVGHAAEDCYHAGRRAEGRGYAGQLAKKAGNQGRILHDPHIDHLHGEDGCRPSGGPLPHVPLTLRRDG